MILLWGAPGAGKTTFAQGLGCGLGVIGPVQSPTFTLIAEYRAPVLAPDGEFAHIDLFRLEASGDIDAIGLDEYFDRDDCVTAIEWPDRADVARFPPHWSVEIQVGNGDDRMITIREPDRG